MRILVTGSNGMLGADLAKQDMVGVSHDDLDILDPASVRTVLQSLRPDWVINCAAYTNVDGCEDNEAAYRLNAEGPHIVVAACAEIGARMVQISTDFVFDGAQTAPYAEDAVPNPINAYGRGKLAGEPEGAVIVRTAWLFGKHGRCFPSTMIRLAEAGKPIRVVADQRGSPTYTADLAHAIRSLVDSSPAPGVYHLVNSGEATWYELAEETLRVAGLSADLTPISSTEWPSPAQRPAYSVLANTKAPPLRSWQDALQDYISEAYHEAQHDDANPAPWRF